MAADRALTIRLNGSATVIAAPAMGQLLQAFRLHGCTRGTGANGTFAAVCAAVNSKVIRSINRQPKGRHKAKDDEISGSNE